MAGVLPFHASRCIQKRKAFAQSTPGSNSRGSRPRELEPACTSCSWYWSEHDSTQRILAHCSAVRHCALLLHHLRGAASDELQCRCRECFFHPMPGFSLGLGGAAAATGRAATDKTLNPVNCACPRVSRALISARSLSLLLRDLRSCL